MIEDRGRLFVSPIRTLEPSVVRASVFGAMLLGATTTLPSVVFVLLLSQFTLDIKLIGESAAMLAIGIIIGMSLSGQASHNISLSTPLVFRSGICISSSLVAISISHSPLIILASGFTLGMGLGFLLNNLLALLLNVIDQIQITIELLGLAWCWGAMIIAGFSWISFQVLTPSLTTFLLAALVCAATISLILLPSFNEKNPESTPVQWSFFFTPSKVLILAVIVLLGSMHGVASNLFPVYISGKMGSGIHLSFAIPISYWLSVATAALASRRFATLEKRPGRTLIGISVCSIGCIFLLRANEPTGMIAGTVAFGTGVGITLSLAVTWISQQMNLKSIPLSYRLLPSFLLASVIATWLTAHLTAEFGLQVIILTALLTALCATLTLMVLLVDNWLARKL